jgi:hypothetical protein
MKKFSNIEKIDLHDNEPKSFNETLKGLLDEMLSIKITGDAELAGKIDYLTIDGKDALIGVIEKLTNVHILKERIKILEGVKVVAIKNTNLNWIDQEIKNINESIEKYINGEIKENIDIQVDEKIINE